MGAQSPTAFPNVAVMQALGLLLDIAWHDGGLRDLAVAAEAWTLAGYNDGSIDISHAGGHEAIQERISRARFHRTRRLLIHDAQGVLKTVRDLVAAGVIDGGACSERRHQRWVDRGGHAAPTFPGPEST